MTLIHSKISWDGDIAIYFWLHIAICQRWRFTCLPVTLWSLYVPLNNLRTIFIYCFVLCNYNSVSQSHPVFHHSLSLKAVCGRLSGRRISESAASRSPDHHPWSFLTLMETPSSSCGRRPANWITVNNINIREVTANTINRLRKFILTWLSWSHELLNHHTIIIIHIALQYWVYSMYIIRRNIAENPNPPVFANSVKFSNVWISFEVFLQIVKSWLIILYKVDRIQIYFRPVM